MERRTFLLITLASLGAVAAWLWLTPKGRRAAARAAVPVSQGATAVVETVRPLIDTALAWLTSTDSKANLTRLWPTITRVSDQYGLPPLILARLAYIESGFRSDVLEKRKLGAANEIGITQVIPKYHPAADLSTPETQLAYTAKTLAQYRTQFGSWDKAVAAWNAGPGNVAKALAKPGDWRANLPSQITRNYLAKLDAGVGSTSSYGYA